MATGLVVALAYAILYAASVLVFEAVNKHLAALEYEKEGGHLFYAILLIATAILLFFLVVVMLLAVLPLLRVVALLAGTGLMFAGLYMFRNRKKAERTLSYYLKILACLLLGSLSLWIGL